MRFSLRAIVAAARRVPVPIRRQRGYITPALLGVVAARRRSSGPTGPLASYTANLWGCYSLVQLLTNYSGSCLKVRRSSDNTTQDIGFSGGVVDSAALLSFVGANDGFVETWYDQSGGAHDLGQSTSANQPKIVDAGTYMGELCWDGSNDYMQTGNSGTPTAVTIHLAARNRSPQQGTTGAYSRLYQYDPGDGSGAGAIVVRNTGTGDTYRTNIGIATGVLQFDPESAADTVVTSLCQDRSQGSIPLQNLFYTNGAANTGADQGGSIATGSYTAAPWYIGSGVGGNQPCHMAAKSVLIYEAAQTQPTIAAIAAIIYPTPAVDVLDSYTTSLWGAWGLRRMRSTYAGSSIRVRRSSDNAEQDIGFTSGFLDTAALATFCGANDGYVTKIYDQSGGGNDFAQATGTKQPLIYIAGVFQETIYFDAGTDWMTTVNNSGTPTAFTIFMRNKFRNMTDSVGAEHTANYNLNNACIIEPGGSGNRVRASLHGTGGGGGYIASDFDMNAVQQVLCYAFDRSASGAAKSRMFNGGVLMTRNASADSGTAPTGSFTAGKWSIGARETTGGAPCALNLNHMAIYEAVVTDANVERISRLLG